MIPINFTGAFDSLSTTAKGVIYLSAFIIMLVIVVGLFWMAMRKRKIKKEQKQINESFVEKHVIKNVETERTDVRIKDGTEISCPNCGEKLIWKE